CWRSYCRARSGRLWVAWQAHGEFGVRTGLALHRDRAAMLLGHDVVADRQAKPGTLAGWLGGEERLEQLVPDLRRNAGAVVAHLDLYRLAEIAGRHHEGGTECSIAIAVRTLIRGVEAVAKKVEKDPCDLLWGQFHRPESP